MKSIKTKILATTIAILFFSLAAVGGLAVYMSYQSTMDMLENTMIEAVEIAANQVDANLEEYRSLVKELAESGQLQVEDKELLSARLREVEKRHNISMIGITDAEGISLETGISITDRDYYQAAKSSGKPYVSDPVLRKDDGSLNIFVSAPIMKDNQFQGVIFAGLDATFLSNLVAGISIGGTGNAAILDSTGTTLAYADIQTVLDRYNTQDEVKNDPSLKQLAEIERKMAAGETGFGGYTYGGKSKVMAYTSIPNTNGWSIDLSVLKSELMKGTYAAIGFILGGLVIAMIIAMALVLNLANSIANPVISCVSRIQKLAEGDLKTEVPRIKNNDETGQLAVATEKIVSTMNGIITDMNYGLNKMAEGDFTVDSQAKHLYVGDFKPLASAMYDILDKLTGTLLQINTAADQVASGSDQVSSGAQALSQGATEQASSVEELAATINEISAQVQSNASDAGLASQMAENVGQEMTYSNQQMQHMIEAMKNIDNSSQEIGKIIKVIEDIAFQTNILALNAAVEAARAGSAGKGFAVVADEVRNLAGKSAEASKDTSALIEESLQAVVNGTKIADETAKSLLMVVDGVKEVVNTIDKIADATKEQASSIAQVTTGVDQISAVVQTNSATAEESAAASQELSAQSQMLRDVVGKFKLKKDVNISHSYTSPITDNTAAFTEMKKSEPEYYHTAPDLSKY